MSKKPTRVPTVSNITSIADTGVFHVEKLDVRFHNGEQRTYQRLKPRGHGAVLVIPVFEHNQVGLIYEYSGGTLRYELGLPKGKIDAGEEILKAANRELQEEIGYASNHLEHLTTLTLAPGYQANITHIVLARKLYEAPLVGDEPEELVLIQKDLETLEQWVYDEDLTEARSIAALFLAKQHILS